MDEDKKGKEGELGEKERFEILLEEMRHSFKVVGEGHSILANKIDAVDQKVDKKTQELEQMIMISNKSLTEEIKKVESKLGQRIDKVEVRLGNVAQDVGVLKQDVKTINNKLDKVIDRQDEQDVKTEKVYQKIFYENTDI